MGLKTNVFQFHHALHRRYIIAAFRKDRLCDCGLSRDFQRVRSQSLGASTFLRRIRCQVFS